MAKTLAQRKQEERERDRRLRKSEARLLGKRVEFDHDGANLTIKSLLTQLITHLRHSAAL